MDKLNVVVSGKISPQMNEVLVNMIAEKKITKSALIRTLLSEYLLKLR